jgi:hypothetical protein
MKHEPDQHGATARIPRLSTRDFALWGIEDLAYVKPIVVDGEQTFAIHGADGRELAVVSGRESAFAAVIQNDMAPLSVH